MIKHFNFILLNWLLFHHNYIVIHTVFVLTPNFIHQSFEEFWHHSIFFILVTYHKLKISLTNVTIFFFFQINIIYKL